MTAAVTIHLNGNKMQWKWMAPKAVRPSLAFWLILIYLFRPTLKLHQLRLARECVNDDSISFTVELSL